MFVYIIVLFFYRMYACVEYRLFLEFKRQMSDQNIVFEKGDYLAMVLGAFWALWPALAITLAVIVGISLFFL